MSKDNNNDHKNIFEILDGIMFQLSRTKKMFMIMILTVLILPPAAILVMTTVSDSPFHQQFEERLQEKLEKGELTLDEYQHFKNKFENEKPRHLLHPPQLVILIISLVWLGIGIRQWVVLSKWDKTYQQFKKEQKKTDKKFEDDSDEK